MTQGDVRFRNYGASPDAVVNHQLVAPEEVWGRKSLPAGDRRQPLPHSLKTALSDLGHLGGSVGAWGIRGCLQATVNDAQSVLARQDALRDERL
jgi:hypothetical protein